MGALAIPIIGGLALGGLGVGAAALAKNQESNIASQAAAQENQNSMMAMEQQSLAQQNLMQNEAWAAQQTASQQQSLASQIGDPVKNPGNIQAALGYGSNAPLFSATPNTGRSTLLGN